MHPNVKARLLNAMFRGDAITFNTTWFLGLHKDNLSTSTLPTTATEVARSNGYSRFKCISAGTTDTTACWSTATSVLAVKNSTGFQFADPTGNWSSVNAVALYDSSVTSGAGASTCWFFQNLNTTVNVTAGNPVRFSSAQLTIFLE